MFSAGLRVGAITSLKIRDLEKIEKYQLYKINVYENDDGEYITFCTPEGGGITTNSLALKILFEVLGPL